ncbi:S-adenosyl-L-methionine-dependent methyltransferase [Tribonema minus]|uniref:DNA (cytosine-5-)-methyltransferase n=1 Tax=Tribonema minus TaxID=303371 RepID=A0A835Z6C7_9STRA|nr:S-adenosyl-L-methionine-dependent methyltransferase [Tribonema minus]
MMYVIDLFSGAGGFSEGARQAGAVVILAVDCWQAALDVHAANHLDCHHWREEVGGHPAELAGRLRAFIGANVPAGQLVHVHASPPCQRLSKANRSSRDTDVGLRLTRFALDVVQAVGCHSWTIEQVSAPAVRKLMDDRGVKYRHLHFDKYGVPSIRRRLIASSVPLDDLPVCVAPPLTLREVMTVAGMQPPEGYDAQRDGSSKPTRRRLDDTSYTVTTRAPVLWNDALGKELALPHVVRSLLQTFPPGYKFGKHSKKMVANAVPPEMSRRLLLHVMRHNSDAPTLTTAGDRSRAST